MKRTVLIVDDDPFFRLILSRLLTQEGYPVLTGSDGLEGVALFERERPDLILMDALMPGLNGFDATRRIKALAGQDQFIPILFLTSLEDEKLLAQCLSCGGDDFLSKPVSRTLLQARMNAWVRRLELAEQAAQDRQAVEEVILKMRQGEGYTPDYLEILMTSVDRTTGDVIFSALRPDGVQHVMVGDFTGHGLSAAIGGPMVSDVFYSMTAKGYAFDEIVGEINTKLFHKTPMHMWLAAAFAQIDRRAGRCDLFNAGLPDALLYHHGEFKRRIRSSHPPLGVRMSVPAAALAQTLTIQPGDRLFIATDGIVETRSLEGELFGQQRLEVLLPRFARGERPLSAILESLDAFRGARDTHDDITMAAILC
ncbi:MAG: fused response regulator/phosphatase [Magnetococcales bacterium]|nr:fused response regulator/phosphatase [Magnetococcales bacterium]